MTDKDGSELDGHIMENSEIILFLQRVPLFAQFHEDELKLLVQTATICEYQRGNAIVRENEQGNEFFLIMRGNVEVRKGEQRLATLGAGQFFGEMALLDEESRSADVISVEDTQCMVITSSILHPLIKDHPDMALKMLAELTRRLRNTDQDSVAELEKRVSDRTRELSTLYEVTAVASESLNLRDTLERSLDRVLRSLNTERGAIALIDESSGRLRIEAYRGLPDHLVDQVNLFEHGEGIGHWIVEHGVPLVIFDMTQDHRVPQELQSAIPPASYVGVPMRAQGRVLGVLGVLRAIQDQFSVEEVALLASIADQIGVAIENAQLYERAQHLGVIEERQRLARDLHDSVTQSIYSVTLFAEVSRRMTFENNLEQVREYLDELRETAQQALKELRLLVYELRPSLLEEEGLLGALQQRLNTVEQRAGVQSDLRVPDDILIPKNFETELYHIAQEALNNSLKHSGATHVVVELQAVDGEIYMNISDNGTGFEVGQLQQVQGVGMTSMQERAQKLNGQLSIDSATNTGTTISVRIPQGGTND